MTGKCLHLSRAPLLVLLIFVAVEASGPSKHVDQHRTEEDVNPAHLFRAFPSMTPRNKRSVDLENKLKEVENELVDRKSRLTTGEIESMIESVSDKLQAAIDARIVGVEKRMQSTVDNLNKIVATLVQEADAKEKSLEAVIEKTVADTMRLLNATLTASLQNSLLSLTQSPEDELVQKLSDLFLQLTPFINITAIVSTNLALVLVTLIVGIIAAIFVK